MRLSNALKIYHIYAVALFCINAILGVESANAYSPEERNQVCQQIGKTDRLDCNAHLYNLHGLRVGRGSISRVGTNAFNSTYYIQTSICEASGKTCSTSWEQHDAGVINGTLTETHTRDSKYDSGDYQFIGDIGYGQTHALLIQVQALDAISKDGVTTCAMADGDSLLESSNPKCMSKAQQWAARWNPEMSFVCAIVHKKHGNMSDDTYDIVGCVPGPAYPTPPIFNAALFGLTYTPSLYLPQGQLNDPSKLPGWFREIGSTFEAPALQVLCGPPPDAGGTNQNVITTTLPALFPALEGDEHSSTPSPKKQCLASQTYSVISSEGSSDQVFNYDPSIICGYLADSSGQNNKDTFLGCIPRPSIQQGSNYSIIAMFRPICGIEEAIQDGKDVTLDADGRIKQLSYDYIDPNDTTKGKACFSIDGRDGSKSLDPYAKPYQGVELFSIQAHPYDIIGVDADQTPVQIGPNYTLYKKDQSLQNSMQFANITRDILLQSPDRRAKGIGPLPLVTLMDNTQTGEADFVKVEGIREHFLIKPAQCKGGGSVAGCADLESGSTQLKQDLIYLSPYLDAKNNGLMPRVRAIIPQFSNTQEALFVDFWSNQDPSITNCSSYISTNGGVVDKTIQLERGFLPAGVSRDQRYCYCDQYKSDKYPNGCGNDVPESKDEGVETCQCPICGDAKSVNTNADVKSAVMAVCPGLYQGPSNIANWGKDQGTQDQICVYAADRWDFIGGKDNPLAPITDDQKPLATKALICAPIPTTCDVIPIPQDWNGRATWGSQDIGKDIVGTCEEDYAKSPDGPPIADCIGGVYTNFRQACVVPTQCDAISVASEKTGWATWELLKLEGGEKREENLPGVCAAGYAGNPMADCIGGEYTNFRNACTPLDTKGCDAITVATKGTGWAEWPATAATPGQTSSDNIAGVCASGYVHSSTGVPIADCVNGQYTNFREACVSAVCKSFTSACCFFPDSNAFRNNINGVDASGSTGKTCTYSYAQCTENGYDIAGAHINCKTTN